MIYFDNNATTRMFECVLDAMRPFHTELFANPASAIGQFSGVARAVAADKRRLGTLLGAESGDHFVITSGATESNNLALLGSARANPGRKQIVVSAIEHPSVLESVAVLEAAGYEICRVPVNPNGIIDPRTVAQALSSQTLIVSVMLANNETGVIQPLQTIAQLVKTHDPAILVHTDATQAVGKIAVNLAGNLADVDLFSFSAHKFHGPKGAGGLFVRDREAIAPILFGGGQQTGIRPGTENPAALAGMVTALSTLLGASEAMERTRLLRDELEDGIVKLHKEAVILGASAERLPTTSNICMPGVDADTFVDQLASRGIAVSTGSACAHGSRKPSYVAAALGLSYEEAQSCIRISLSVESTQDEVNTFLRILPEVLS